MSFPLLTRELHRKKSDLKTKHAVTRKLNVVCSRSVWREHTHSLRYTRQTLSRTKLKVSRHPRSGRRRTLKTSTRVVCGPLHVGSRNNSSASRRTHGRGNPQNEESEGSSRRRSTLVYVWEVLTGPSSVRSLPTQRDRETWEVKKSKIHNSSPVTLNSTLGVCKGTWNCGTETRSNHCYRKHYRRSETTSGETPGVWRQHTTSPEQTDGETDRPHNVLLVVVRFWSHVTYWL